MKKTLLLPKELDLTPEQQARLKYEGNFYKVTVRFSPDMREKVEHLISVHGDISSALTYAINQTSLSDRTKLTTTLEHQRENEYLRNEVDRLKAELAAAKSHEQPLTNKAEAVNRALENLEQTHPKIDLEQVFDHPFFDSDLLAG